MIKIVLRSIFYFLSRHRGASIVFIVGAIAWGVGSCLGANSAVPGRDVVLLWSLIFAFVGAGLGAIGSSSSYLTEENLKEVRKNADHTTVKVGHTSIPNPAHLGAIQELEARARAKDRWSLCGWGFVIAGAALSLGLQISIVTASG